MHESMSFIKCAPPFREYEAHNRKTCMNSITLQPLVADQAFMPHMEAMYVPFQMRYGNLTCYKGLQSERPKC